MIWTGRNDGNDVDVLRYHQKVKARSLDTVCNESDAQNQESNKNFGFIGFCCDEGVKRNKGRTGAKDGPDSIRSALSGMPYSYFGKNKYGLYDFGDVRCDDGDLETAQGKLQNCVQKILQLKCIPVVLGGGHETAYGTYAGVFDYFHPQGKTIGVLNFDAHFDIRKTADDSHTSGTPFWNAYQLAQNNTTDFKYFCFGISESGNTQNLFDTAQTMGVQYCTDTQTAIEPLKCMDAVLDFAHSVDVLYITIDLDTFSAGIAPGVSALNPVGTSVAVVETLLKKLHESNIRVGAFDVVELNPSYDTESITARLAARLIHTFITTNA